MDGQRRDLEAPGNEEHHRLCVAPRLQPAGVSRPREACGHDGALVDGQGHQPRARTALHEGEGGLQRVDNPLTSLVLCLAGAGRSGQRAGHHWQGLGEERGKTRRLGQARKVAESELVQGRGKPERVCPLLEHRRVADDDERRQASAIPALGLLPLLLGPLLLGTGPCLQGQIGADPPPARPS